MVTAIGHAASTAERGPGCTRADGLRWAHAPLSQLQPPRRASQSGTTPRSSLPQRVASDQLKEQKKMKKVKSAGCSAAKPHTKFRAPQNGPEAQITCTDYSIDLCREYDQEISPGRGCYTQKKDKKKRRMAAPRQGFALGGRRLRIPSPLGYSLASPQVLAPRVDEREAATERGTAYVHLLPQPAGLHQGAHWADRHLSVALHPDHDPQQQHRLRHHVRRYRETPGHQQALRGTQPSGQVKTPAATYGTRSTSEHCLGDSFVRAGRLSCRLALATETPYLSHVSPWHSSSIHVPGLPTPFLPSCRFRTAAYGKWESE